jgi:GWxTD domain-containing protein
VFLCFLSTPELKAEKPKGKKLNRINLASLYDENRFTSFDAVIYHESEEKSIVYLSVKLKDLLYTTNLRTGTHESDFKISYELFDSYESKLAVDTGSLVFRDTISFGLETEMQVNFDIRATFPGEYLLKIKLSDINRQDKNSVTEFITVSKSSKISSQNFLVVDKDNDPVFNLSLSSDEQFRIRYNSDSAKQVTIRYYNKEQPIAKTPFSVEKIVPVQINADSLYTLFMFQGETEFMRLRYPGIYLIQTDPTQTEGLTLFRFDEGYPEIESPLQALKPLRYLTTQREFDDLMNYSDYKTAVDSFWLERATNQPERAKNMIARYYQRVVAANQMFTSFKEGWKTDRGIVYIIYGPPSEVYRKNGEEEWIYGERSNLLSIRFYFNLVENPFSFNDYALERSSIYKTSWYIAVENWRR